jgi:tetratricopeptide (TPR) repeat protein/uncharacterized protein (DUF2141 family)
MGYLRVIAHPVRVARIPAALVLAALLALSLQSQQTGDASTLHGTVRDSQGKAVAAATVFLRAQHAPQPITAHTDSKGNYSFAALQPGVYALRAAMAGYGDAEVASLFLGSKETKTVDLTLPPAKNSASKNSSAKPPEFYDQPQFTVAGVTDTTNLGGHGSDTVVRTRETIAKETATLGNATSQPAPSADTEKSLREKIEREPNNADLHHALGDVEEKHGNSLDAVRDYERAAELEPAESYLFDWGSELLLHHAPEPALEVFTKGNRLFPHSVRMLIGIGAAWFARGSFDRAVQKICEASDLNPSDATPYEFLGKMQNAEKTAPVELVEKLHRFAMLQPGNAEANYYYAVGLWKRRQDSHEATSVVQVETLLNQAIRLDPKFGAAYLQLGILRAEQRNFPEAISNFQQAIQTDSHMEEGHFRLAQAYRQTGETDKAKAELQIYDRMAKESAEKTERERHEIRQFVYTLRDQPPAQAH